MVIEVKNCKYCPFSNYDTEYGRNICNLAETIGSDIDYGDYRQQLPHDKRHKNCPLTEQLTIVVDLSE